MFFTEARQRDESELAAQREERRKKRLHDEAERASRTDRAEAEALKQLQQCRQNLSKRVSFLDGKYTYPFMHARTQAHMHTE